MSWQPSASVPVLQQRARLYRHIRDFFASRDVLEVDVPLISQYATVDPFIDSLNTSLMGRTHYLQTSPEFFLKRVLAAYQQDIYSLGKAFRQGEQGTRHCPEFTLLEWYRVGWDEQQLILEVRELIGQIIPELAWHCVSYRDVFQQHLSLDPHLATAAELQHCAEQHLEHTLTATDKSPWLDLLFTHCIEPLLPAGMVAIYDYPACQAALARVENDSQQLLVAKRFEVYINGIEIANGYWELCDGAEQERRFKADIAYRQQQGFDLPPYDQTLVDALNHGQFPSCAGVALGIDRLLMCLLQQDDIQAVMTF